MNRWHATVWAFVFTAGMAATAQAQGTGLNGEYYNTQDFTGAVALRLDANVWFNFDPGTANPPVTALPAGITDKDNISVRWTGTVEAPVTGAVTFYFRCDDGSYLYVDGRLVTDQFRGQGVPNPGPTGIVNMVAGQRYSIQAEMEQGGGGVQAFLEWSYTGQAQVMIPTVRLYPEVAAPKFSDTPGALPGSRLITITCDTPGATINYTLNGGASTPYTVPLLVTGNAAFVASATKASWGNSQNAVANYTLTDVTPPTIQQIVSAADDRLYVAFSEPLTATGDNAANYAVAPAGPVVAGAVRQAGNRSVDLNITGLVVGNTYTLTINNIADNVPNAITVPESRVFVHRPPPSAGLVDLYRLDEGTGTTGADSSGNGTGGGNGTLIGSTLPKWVAGRFGNALSFEGIRGEFQVATDLSPVLGATGTLSLWIKSGCRGNQNARASNDVQTIFGGADGATNDVIFGFLNSNTGAFSIQAGDGLVFTTAAGVNNSTWRHLAFTRNGTTGAVQIFLDGVLSVTGTSDVGNKTRSMRLFGRLDGGGDYSHWNGLMDDIRVYNSVLTAAEILNMANTPPVVSAGPDQVVASGLAATLAGTATDDGKPAPPTLTHLWTLVSGPGTATFAPPAANTLNPTVTFSQGGTYVLRLTTSDGLLSTSDDVSIALSRVSVTPTTGLTTTEAGGTDSFDVVLTTAPASDVTITIVSSDTTEGTVSTALLTFTSMNWNVAQTVTVTGVDDLAFDGPIGYTIQTGPTVSADMGFSGLVVPDVGVTNTDDDTPGITVTAVTPLITGEDGTFATFTVVLDTQPTTNVTINITSTNILEGTVTTAMPLTFTNGNWNVAQTVTITGVDDLVIDLNQGYTIIIDPAAGDAGYVGIDPANLSAVNVDDEVIPVAAAWGNCGMLGVEVLLGLGLAAALRRRAARRR